MNELRFSASILVYIFCFFIIYSVDINSLIQYFAAFLDTGRNTRRLRATQLFSELKEKTKKHDKVVDEDCQTR